MNQITSKLRCSRLWKWRSPRAKGLVACSIHLPSLITTTTLICFNFSSTWFSSVGAPNQNSQFNALQFAAKVHEIVIVASLSVVAVSCVQHELCRRQGLALGGVLTAFQITNILSLFSPALWRKCFTNGYTSYRIQFGLFITILTILSAIVGPSSAILMLPSVDSWDLPIPLTWDDGTVKDARIFLSGNDSLIWPSNITTSNFLPPECIFTDASTSLQDHCASAGLPILLTTPWKGALSGDGYSQREVMWNFSMTGNASVRLGNGPPNFNIYNRALQGIAAEPLPQSMDPHILTQSTFSSMNNAMISIYSKALSSARRHGEMEWSEIVSWRFSLQNGSRTLAPQTFVTCHTEPLLLDASTNAVLAGQDLIFPLRGAVNWSMSATPLTDKWNSTKEQISMWVESPELYNRPSISFALIGRTEQPMQYYNYSANMSPYVLVAPEIVTCSVYASWHPVDMTLRPGTPFRVSSAAIDNGPEYYKAPKNQRDYFKFSTLDWVNNMTEPGTRDIYLKTSWADLAFPPEITVEKIVSSFEKHLSWDRKLATQSALSFLITDALSRFDSSAEVVLARQIPTANDGFVSDTLMHDISTLDMSNLTEIRITRDRYGYSYSSSGTTRRLAIGVMFIHIAVALIHTTLVVWHGWWCPGLQSLSDFFVLAVESPNPESSPTNNSQVDFATDKHKCNIQVREIGDEKLEMKISGRSDTLYSSSGNKQPVGEP
ncbi:hypothetical protein IFR05_006267 [Cadophora sp. M221]|nr:hypothetical protein IFR05_006267 [Cadophora sp. M221]